MTPLFSALATLCALRPAPEQAVIEAFTASLPSGVELQQIAVSIRPHRRAPYGTRAKMTGVARDGMARARVDYLSSSGRVKHQAWATIRYQICGDVAVARQAINVGKHGVDQAVMMEKRCGIEMKQLGLDAEALRNARSRRQIAAGQVLHPSDLDLGLVVVRNSDVQLMFRRGALRVRTHGRSLDDGHPGDVVRVEHAGRREWVHARVVGPNVVEVLP